MHTAALPRAEVQAVCTEYGPRTYGLVACRGLERGGRRQILLDGVAHSGSTLQRLMNRFAEQMS